MITPGMTDRHPRGTTAHTAPLSRAAPAKYASTFAGDGRSPMSGLFSLIPAQPLVAALLVCPQSHARETVDAASEARSIPLQADGEQADRDTTAAIASFTEIIVAIFRRRATPGSDVRQGRQDFAGLHVRELT